MKIVSRLWPLLVVVVLTACGEPVVAPAPPGAPVLEEPPLGLPPSDDAPAVTPPVSNTPTEPRPKPAPLSPFNIRQELPSNLDFDFYGEWVWVAVFQDRPPVTGYLSVTRGTRFFKDSLTGGEGYYVECLDRPCERGVDNGSMQGVGVMGRGKVAYTEKLVAKFYSYTGSYRLVAVDEDGALTQASEKTGLKTFLGNGVLYPKDGKGTGRAAAVGIFQLGRAPLNAFPIQNGEDMAHFTSRVRAYAKTVKWATVPHKIEGAL